jgi:hypothetical protein
MRTAPALLLLALAGPLAAAEPDATTRPASSDAEPAQTADTTGGARASGTEGAPESPDEFVPSEDISEDLSVAFPSDI